MKKKKECKLFEEPVYIVEWDDAHTANETLSKRDIKEENNIRVTTTGYLVDENDERIAICGFRFGKGENTGYRDTHFIPKKMIKKIGVMKRISKEEYEKNKVN